MSEVKKYRKLIGEHPNSNWCYVVRESDFDRVTAERDAALEEVEALKHWRDLALQFDNHRMRALWHLKTLVSDGAHYDAAAAFLAEPPIPQSELQQRLTAADERVDALEKDAARWNFFSSVASQLQAFPHSWGMMTPEKMNHMCDEAMTSALKPAEGGGDE